MAIPNALITLALATWIQSEAFDEWNEETRDPESGLYTDTAKAAQLLLGSFTVVKIFILYNRSRTSYNRWWEGGTLLQKTRGEWFNAYSSIMAFTSTKPELQDQVVAYTHLLARLMSLLMCCGLQQVSPHRDRPFEIIDLEGIEPESMEFLNSAPDKVEIILQWIQRSMVLHMQTGVLPIAPPILSRAFQEVSRGIVNLQNARKIADFPYPFPLAQVSMMLQILHWAVMPMASAMAMPRGWAVCFAFSTVFVLWSIHFNALDLEFPFGSRLNDLPMNEMQQDWNKSICTLLDKRATRPPVFAYDAEVHTQLVSAMSDASALYIPSVPQLNKGNAVIKVQDKKNLLRPIRKTCTSEELSAFKSSIDSVSPKDQVNAGKLTGLVPSSAPNNPPAAASAAVASRKEGPDVPAAVATSTKPSSSPAPASDGSVTSGSAPGSTLAADASSASSRAPTNQTSSGQSTGAALSKPPAIEPLVLDGAANSSGTAGATRPNASGPSHTGI